MKKFFILMAAVGSMLCIMGCENTADGVGEDTEDAVDAVKDATN